MWIRPLPLPDFNGKWRPKYLLRHHLEQPFCTTGIIAAVAEADLPFGTDSAFAEASLYSSVIGRS